MPHRLAGQPLARRRIPAVAIAAPVVHDRVASHARALTFARRLARILPLALAAALAPAPTPAAAAPPPELFAGVARIAAPGVPGPLCAYGGAEPVVVGDAGDGTRLPVVATGRLGAGRVVAFGHDGYFGRAALETADTGRLVLNAVRWAGGRALARVAVVGKPELAAWLRDQGIAVDETGLGGLAGHHVAVFTPWAQSDAEIAAAADFTRGGGGLVVAVTGWGWAQLNPGRDLRADFVGNRLLAPAGIQWPNDWLSETDPAGGYTVAGAPSALTAGDGALAAAVAHANGTRTLSPAELDQVSRTLVANAVCAPDDDTLFLPRLRDVIPSVIVPSPEDPVTPAEVLDRVAVTLQTRELFALPPGEARAHPAAAIFPGPVPAAAPRRDGVAVPVDLGVPDWHSTGLYAPPGEVIHLSVPPEVAGRGLGVRIGAHADTLWGVAGDWTRMPEVSRWWPLDARDVDVFNPFGGLVYITVPRGQPPALHAITVSGAVDAPLYRVGGDVDAWRAEGRLAPAPWAEIAGRSMIVTTRAADVRDLDDPGAVAEAWDRVLDASAALATQSSRRDRPERFVADQQISAGYMHAGYPLMCHLDQAAHLVDAAHLTTEGNWGFFHEVGHNHQSADWTFEGTGEVTVNLFTLHAFDRVVGIPPLAHERGSVDFVRSQMAKYDFARPDFTQWKSDPFLALAMYVQLQHAFGWEAYQKVFAEYRDLPAAARPATDDARRDQWLVRFSRAVGRDLGPFFQLWGVPTSDAARAAVADLPDWVPAGFPPGYVVAPTATRMPTATATQVAAATPTPGAPPSPPPSAPPPDPVPRPIYLPSLAHAGG